MSAISASGSTTGHGCVRSVRVGAAKAVLDLTETSEPLYPFVFTHYPVHRSGIRNQSSGLISSRRRFALLLEML
ncbi:hypothetical protein BRY73_21755 [Ochrobactrum sp. P6BS-III]|nr:hypothetical protein BRY73_21755 [Ochrobactrum sp. P6BS-III]